MIEARNPEAQKYLELLADWQNWRISHHYGSYPSGSREEIEPKIDKEYREFLKQLRTDPGIFRMQRLSFAILPDHAGGNFYYDFDREIAGRFFLVPNRTEWEVGIKVKLSQDNQKWVEVVGASSMHILHLPENTQILIHLQNSAPGNDPDGEAIFEGLVAHWVPQITKDARTVTVPRVIPIQLPMDKSFPPPLFTVAVEL